jgi:hypothetical protein
MFQSQGDTDFLTLQVRTTLVDSPHYWHIRSRLHKNDGIGSESISPAAYMPEVGVENRWTIRREKA